MLIYPCLAYIWDPECVPSLHLIYTRFSRLNIVFRGSSALLSVLGNKLQTRSHDGGTKYTLYMANY